MISSLVLLAALQIADPVPLAEAETPSSPGFGYELIFADEFEGTVVDTSAWAFRVGERTGTGINGFNREEDAWIENGNLTIRASTGLLDGIKRYFGGGLISRHGFGFGYYEVRSRPAMAGTGVHSAFWQRGVSQDGVQNIIFEIDSYEIDSPSNIATNNLYIEPNSYGFRNMPWPYRSNIPIKLDDGWVIDAFEYAPDGVTFYDNGRVVGTARYPKDFPDLVAQQNVWLTALNGVGRVSEETQPDYTLFDYFRYYTKDYPGQNLLPNGTFEYNRSQTPLQTPMAWAEHGDSQASFVISGDAQLGTSHLRHAAAETFAVRTTQSLHYIRNGSYEFSLRYRTSGASSQPSVSVQSGSEVFSRVLEPSSEWRTVVLGDITIADQTPIITLSTEGAPNASVDFDDVEFYKPTGGSRPPRPVPLDLTLEPVWELFADEPMKFSGEDAFFFIDRTVGYGEEVTAELELNPDSLQNALPIMRSPREGKNGWAVGVTDAGGAYCLMGSLSDHRRAVAENVYVPGTRVRVSCEFGRGTVNLLVNGRLAASTRADGYGTTDPTAAGRLGATVAWFDAVGDVTVHSEHASPTDRSLKNFRGEIGSVKIWNGRVTQ